MRRAWLLVLGLGCGLVASCFDAPSADVMFSCDPASAPACPDGYTCESDGCCHRDGSDSSANAGLCRTGADGGTDSATSLLTTGSSGTETSSSSGGTSESGPSTDPSTDTGSTESSSTDATSTDATSTGNDASSSGAGSTDTGSSSTG